MYVRPDSGIGCLCHGAHARADPRGERLAHTRVRAAQETQAESLDEEDELSSLACGASSFNISAEESRPRRSPRRRRGSEASGT